MKLKRSSYLKFSRVDDYQHDIKSFGQLTFFEKINAEYDWRANKLINNTLADEKFPFTIELKSVRVVITGNQIMLNLTTKAITHVYWIIFEDYLKIKNKVI